MTRRSTDAWVLFSSPASASSLACATAPGIRLAVARAISIVSSGSRPHSLACVSVLVQAEESALVVR